MSERKRPGSSPSSPSRRKTKHKKVSSPYIESPYMSADEGTPLSERAMSKEAAEVYGWTDPYDPKRNYGVIGHPDAPITESTIAKYAKSQGYTVDDFIVPPLSKEEFIDTIGRIKIKKNAAKNNVEQAILKAYPHKGSKKINKTSLYAIYRALTDKEYNLRLISALRPSIGRPISLNNSRLAKDFFLGFFPHTDLSVRSIISARTDSLPEGYKHWIPVIRGELSILFEKFLAIVEILGKFTETNYTTATFTDPVSNPVSKKPIDFDTTYIICRICLIQLLKDTTENGKIKELLELQNETKLRTLITPLPGNYPPIMTKTSTSGNDKYVITSFSLSDDIEFSPTLLNAAKRYSSDGEPEKCVSDFNPTNFVYLFTVMSSIHATSILYYKGHFYYFGGGYYDDVNPTPKIYSLYLSDFLFTPETHEYYISEVSIISYEKLKNLADFIKQADTIRFEKSHLEPIRSFLIFPEDVVQYKTGCTVDISGKFDSKFHSCVSTSNMVSNRPLDIGGLYKLSHSDLYSEEHIFALHYIFSELQKKSMRKIDEDVISLLKACGDCKNGFYFEPSKLDEWILTSVDVQQKIEKFSQIPPIPPSFKGGKKKRTLKKRVWKRYLH